MKFKIKDREFNVDKKFLIICIVIIIVLIVFPLLFKRQTTKLDCNIVKNPDTAYIEERITTTFKNNKLSKMVIYYKNKPTAEFQYMLQKIYDNYNNQLTVLKNDGGYDYTIELGSDYVSYQSTIDINSIPDVSKNKIGFNNMWTYKDVKANLEENNFTCK